MKKILITAYLAAATLTVWAQNPLSFYAKAGIGTSNFWGENSNSDTKIAHKVEAGAEYVLNRTFAVQSALEFISIGGKDNIEYIGKAKINELYLQIPVMMSARISLGKDYQASLSAGPYIAIGIGGKSSGELYNYSHNSQFEREFYFKINTFGSLQKGFMGNQRFDAGVTVRLAIEYHRFIIGAETQVGFITVNDQLNQIIESNGYGSYLPKNLATFFTLGYRF